MSLIQHTYQIGYGCGDSHNSPKIPLTQQWAVKYHEEQFRQRKVLGLTERAQKIGEWAIRYFWTRTIQDAEPRLDELLEKAGVHCITYRSRGATNVTGKNLNILASEVDGTIVLEFRTRSWGGGVPNTPFFPYGPYYTVTALQILDVDRLLAFLEQY